MSTTLPRRSIRGLLCIALLALDSCGDPPRPPPVAGAADRPGALSRAAETRRFRGTVRFEGELADVRAGFLFVNVFPERGSRFPSYSRRVDLALAAWSGSSIPFEVGPEDDMGGMGVPLGPRPALELRYDPDGAVETKEGVHSSWVEEPSSGTAMEVSLGTLSLGPGSGR